MSAMKRGAAAIACLAAALTAAACGAPAAGDTAATTPQREFLLELAARCGDEYPGRAITAPADDDTFHPAYLGMRIEQCTDEEVRITFLVDDDASRTWVLAIDNEDLVFTHEHMLEGDTLSSNSGWGGRAPAGSGTPRFQHFPDHRWNPAVVPEERRSHWRMRLDTEHGQFVYYLDRGVTPAYRLVFHLGQDAALLAGN